MRPVLAAQCHHLEQSPHFALVAQPPPGSRYALRIRWILRRQGHCARANAECLEPRPLAGEATNRRTALSCGIGERGKIDMGGQILLARRLERIGEAQIAREAADLRERAAKLIEKIETVLPKA